MPFADNPVTRHPWWEQTAMLYLLLLPFVLAAASRHDTKPADHTHEDGWGFAPSVRLLPQRHINSYPPLIASKLASHAHVDEGDWIVAFNGCRVYSSQEVCNALFESYYHRAKAKLERWKQERKV
mmetsp:Transcript_49085/g.123012  ORF Transcript_49085/g.123012 Transcript_49085/m.123012 type:complete len:125 (-) Transcript_49085:1240-1614(-)